MVFSDWLKPGSLPYRVAKRLLQVAFTLFGLLILTFIIGRVMPIVGQDADQSTYQQVYQQLGLDKPLYVQFGIYFNSLLHGDLGNAMLTGRPVVDDIIRVFPATVELATMAIIVGAGLGVPLGVMAAARQAGGLYRTLYQPGGLLHADLLGRHDGVVGVLRLAQLGRWCRARGYGVGRHGGKQHWLTAGGFLTGARMGGVF